MNLCQLKSISPYSSCSLHATKQFRHSTEARCRYYFRGGRNSVSSICDERNAMKRWTNDECKSRRMLSLFLSVFRSFESSVLIISTSSLNLRQKRYESVLHHFVTSRLSVYREFHRAHVSWRSGLSGLRLMLRESHSREGR